MATYYGSSEHGMDDKGRLTLPARILDEIPKSQWSAAAGTSRKSNASDPTASGLRTRGSASPALSHSMDAHVGCAHWGICMILFALCLNLMPSWR